MPAPRQTRDQRIAQLGFDYDQQRSKRDDAGGQLAMLTAELLQLLPVGTDKFEGEFDDFTVSVNPVQGQTSAYDESGIRRALEANPDLWNQITSRRVDTAKLAAALAAGDIQSEFVEKYTVKTDKKPYVDVRVKKKAQ
jgi:hypothetical protein